MAVRCGRTMFIVVNVYCQKLQGKWNKNMPHVLSGVCTILVYAPKFRVWR